MLQKKICMLGSYSVGKTSLVQRFVTGIFNEKYQTSIGVKIDNKTVKAGGEEMKLVLWDIYGEDRFQKVLKSYLTGMSGCFLVVDPTRHNTLEDAFHLQQYIIEAGHAVPCVLVLNKCDLLEEWDIDLDRVAQFERQDRAVLRTSAKTGEGVELAFLRLAQAMLESLA